jgi:GNAT superfamily N-acetyltransferase
VDVGLRERGGEVEREFEPVGRAATVDDIDAVTSCLASAFYDDPLWGFWTFPDEQSRSRDLVPFMRFWTACSLRHSWLRMTDGCEAVTLWTPPGEIYVTPEGQPTMDALLDDLFGRRTPEIQALFDQFEQHMPEGDYYHLEWWATHRDHAGRGLGTALVRDNLARVDALHMPSYLESTNPANLPRYEALGFRRLGEFAPPGGPVITTMWRDAR